MKEADLWREKLGSLFPLTSTTHSKFETSETIGILVERSSRRKDISTRIFL
jgi:hypothetical protein